jgi:hypothetical protein
LGEGESGVVLRGDFTAKRRFSSHSAQNQTAKTPGMPGFQVFPGALGGKKSKISTSRKRVSGVL